MTKQLHGLYAITDPTLGEGERLYAQVEAAILGGARTIQYRDKSGDQSKRLEEATQLLALCHTHNIPLIINDDLALARQIKADGVHLGCDDIHLQQARRELGRSAIIGISCYNSLQQACDAESAGADYVAFGRFFTSATKPHAVKADIDLLKQAKKRLQVPVVAIGGITPENGAQLVQAGADMLAVIQGIFAQPDIHHTCRQFAKLFEDYQR